MAPLWKGPWIMSIRTPKPTLTQYQIFLLHQQSDVFTDLLTTHSLFPQPRSRALDIFLGGERRQGDPPC